MQLNKETKMFNFNMYMVKKNDLFLVAFIALYTSILLFLSYSINISEDETYTINTISYHLPKVIHQSYFFEGQPPLYFILFALWGYLGSGLLFLKMFSIICTGISALYFYKINHLYSDTESSKWMLVIFLLNPFTVWAALEMRLYALLITFSILAIYFFQKFLKTNDRKYLRIHFIICLLGLYTQYFYIFLIISFAFSLLLNKRQYSILKYCKGVIIVILFFLPNLFFLPDQYSMHQSNSVGYSVPAIMARINVVLHTPQEYLLAINMLPNEVWLNRFLRIFFIIFTIYTFRKIYYNSKKKFTLRFEISNILHVFSLLFLFIIGIVLSGIAYSDKYMAVSFPFFVLIFGLYIAYPVPKRRIIYSIIGIYFAALLFIYYRHPVKTYDFKSIATYIKKIEKNREPIFFYRSALSIPFSYYYKGKNAIVPLPYPVRYDTSYLFNIKDTMQLRQSMKQAYDSNSSYLFISDLTEFESTMDMNRDMVDKYLEDNFTVSLDTLYLGWSKNKPLRIRRIIK